MKEAICGTKIRLTVFHHKKETNEEKIVEDPKSQVNTIAVLVEEAEGFLELSDLLLRQLLRHLRERERDLQFFAVIINIDWNVHLLPVRVVCP